MGTTTVTNTSTNNAGAGSPLGSAYEGSGTYEQVAELEWFASGFKGEYFRMGEPGIHSYDVKATSSVAGGNYDVTNISYVDDVVVGIGATPTSAKQITLATPATAPGYMAGAEDVWATIAALTGLADPAV
jgi:hypothetical protein